MTTHHSSLINNGSSPSGISWHQPPRSGGSAGGGRRVRVGPGQQKKQLLPSQALQQQQIKPHDRPRDEILDSSSSDDDGNGDEENYGRLERESDDKKCKEGTRWHAENEMEASLPASDDDDDDDDDEFMNPYVMKPHFHLNTSPPPTMEMAPISSWSPTSATSTKTTTKTSTNTTRRDPSSLLGFDPYSPGRDQQQEHHQKVQFQYPQHNLQNCEMELEMEAEESTIDFTDYGQQQGTSFDSKGDFDNLLQIPHRATYRDHQGQVRSVEHGDCSHTASFSASFLPAPKEQQQQQYSPQYYGEGSPLFGKSSSMASSSGISMPQFFPHRGPIFDARTPSSFGSTGGQRQWGTRIRQRLPIILSGATNTILSVIYHASRTASLLLNGGGQNGNKNNNAKMPLLSSSRFPEKNRHGTDGRRNTSRWGTIYSFRLLLVAMTALLCMRTMSIMIWSLPSETEMSSTTAIAPDGMTIAEQQKHQRQGNEQQQVIVDKMKKAKAHWWSRKKLETSGSSSSTYSSKNAAQQQHQDVVVVLPHAEVYQDGKNVQRIIPEQGIKLEGNLIATDANESSKEDQKPPAAVIVRTEEDGSILIKLPPPKLSLQEPELGFTSSIIESDNADETMYIKLPYQQHPIAAGDSNEEIVSSAKQEIEPPLRGAAPQEAQHPQSSTLMRRRPPPPLFEHEHHHSHGVSGKYRHLQEHEHPGVLHALRKEFDTWMSKHGKQYGSKKEEDHRFSVWRMNHASIAKKNDRHGPCRMTGKAVFGHNLFSDLDPEEFQSRFLTGYRGPRHHEPKGSGSDEDAKIGGDSDASLRHSSYFRDVNRVADGPSPLTLVKRHPSIQRKLDEITAKYGAEDFGEGVSNNNSRLHGTKFQSNYGSSCNWWDISCYRKNGVKWSNGCEWWDVSCVLRYVFGYPNKGGTREPVFDESSYPSVLDWRTLGVVTEVNSQGSCGACWAITATETIESANAIATGQLIDLDEEEIIACDGTCEMCNGGWPQNAYEYVRKHGGLPAKTSDYNADWLYLVTSVLAGQSYDLSESQLSSYFAKTCPAGVRESDSSETKGNNDDKSHHSGDDNDNQQYASTYVASTRYAKVKGYGYATDRCVCYTDGSGCGCDHQDEKTAVLNVASYGPAAVCLEASLWQDYTGGIMTSDIGCSSGFLDMNHCVEVVGYAFTDGSSSAGGDENGGSRDGNGHKSGSQDSAIREGYWIVKNQWSTYWGMGGYAYVAMGENTCGILNDMSQVYMN